MPDRAPGGAGGTARNLAGGWLPGGLESCFGGIDTIGGRDEVFGGIATTGGREDVLGGPTRGRFAPLGRDGGALGRLGRSDAELIRGGVSASSLPRGNGWRPRISLGSRGGGVSSSRSSSGSTTSSGAVGGGSVILRSSSEGMRGRCRVSSSEARSTSFGTPRDSPMRLEIRRAPCEPSG